MPQLTPILAALALSATATAASAEMKLAFDWGNIPRCTTGRPNVVPSPTFTLSGVPAGVTALTFRLKDRDVPGYNHGGGTVKVKMPAKGTIPAGAFSYKSPCPPSGRHLYEWTVTAKAGNQTLATAKAQRSYP
ncbi:YbhB/YbcL family Raf kinase inhibitor-like protein [uncultured Thioclava sp.]|uniref:YbhB/YbcL family Raf kinase inhibitor-like protein n=1 Tax=Thioclava arctica TaxID=3238301 RepID=A0ABV3TFR3_9RHOB|nr:YbhB/YbcL family Raf kinase inhibitor-like protein [uncultured Thioclava sp.]